jgi:hypothetical protein
MEFMPVNRRMPKMILIGLILAGTFLTACRGPLFSYRGHPIAEDRRVFLLEGGPHEGRLQTKDLVVTYVYHRNQAVLELTGSVELVYRNFVRDFRLNAHWADCDGSIIEDQVLVRGAYAQRRRLFQFRVDQRLPQFTCMLGFSYGGTAYDTGFDSGFKEFWMVP